MSFGVTSLQEPSCRKGSHVFRNTDSGTFTKGFENVFCCAEGMKTTVKGDCVKLWNMSWQNYIIIFVEIQYASVCKR